MNNHPGHVVVIATAASLALLLSGCSAPAPKVEDTSPIPHLAAALAQVKASGAESVAEVYVTGQFAMVVDQHDGAFEDSTIYPEAYAPRPTSTTWATAPWSLFDPDEITAQVTQLSKRCRQGFLVQVRAASSHSVLSTVECFDFGSTVDTKGNADALLNGKQMRAFDGTWSPLDWQDVATEWKTVAGSGGITGITISDHGVRLTMLPVTTGGCTPSFSRSLDGWTDVFAVCADYGPDLQLASISLDGVTGEALSRTATKLMEADGLVPSTRTSYRLEARGGALWMTYEQGGVSGTAVVA